MDESKKKAHLTELERTISELSKLSHAWNFQKSDSINFFGAVIDNTTVSVLSAYNLLSNTPKQITFTHHSNWYAYMANVHRNFFTNLVAHLEESIKTFCNKNKIAVRSKRDRFEIQLDKAYGDTPTSARQHKKLISFVSSTPEFTDYVDAVLTVLPDNRRDHWYNRLTAVSILRNKSSHSNSTLTAHQLTILIEGGIGDQASNSSILFNTALYRPLIEDCLAFLKEVQSSRKAQQSSKS